MMNRANCIKIALPLLVAGLSAFDAARLNAQNVISANFEGNCACEVLGPAGVVPVGNWNNLADARSPSSTRA